MPRCRLSSKARIFSSIADLTGVTRQTAILLIGGSLTNLAGLIAIPFSVGAGMLVASPILQLLISIPVAALLTGLGWLSLKALSICTGVFSKVRSAFAV